MLCTSSIVLLCAQREYFCFHAYYEVCYFSAANLCTFWMNVVYSEQQRECKFVRGIRSLEKRKALFIWLNKQKVDIVFLQETYSSREIENIWKTQWNGKILLAHGSNHSCGVMIMI